MTKTSIEWCRNPDGSPGEVWNPVTGCAKVSQGCKHCYAERIAERFWATQYPPNEDGSPRKFTDVRVHPERLDEPLHWRKPRRVFVNSMSDLFHPDVPGDFIREVFWTMQRCGWHTFLVLTKRPERMMKWLTYDPDAPVLPNVHFGVSIEDQKTADKRIPLLLQTPAAVRGVSYEPALGPVNFTRIKWARIPVNKKDYEQYGVPAPSELWSMNNALTSRPVDQWNPPKIGLDWIIMGGESGPGARPMNPDWARSVRDQCQAAGVPFFFKQMYVNGKLVKMPELDGRVWDEYPRTVEEAMKG